MILMYDSYERLLIDSFRNETCPVCEMKGSDDFNMAGLKFCSDVHLKYFIYLRLKEMTEVR
jgi:hypothetical protein